MSDELFNLTCGDCGNENWKVSGMPGITFHVHKVECNDCGHVKRF